MKNFILMILLLFVTNAYPDVTPDVSSWKINIDGTTGYSGIAADVQQVSYSLNYTYVKCTGIPSYTIGPWAIGVASDSLGIQWGFGLNALFCAGAIVAVVFLMREIRE